MSARSNRKGSQRGTQRSDVPKDYWKRSQAPLRLADDEFRIRADRQDQQDTLVLDDTLTQINWDDTSGPLTGQVTFTMNDQKAFPLDEGHKLTLQWRVRGTAQWQDVWEMRATEPELSEQADSITFQLADELQYLQRSHEQFKFGKTKRNPNGVRLDAIIRSICKKMGIRVGKLAKLDHRVKKFSVNGTAIDAIQRCLNLARTSDKAGKLVMRMRRGKVEIVPLQRSRDLLLMGPAIIDATYKRSLAGDFATALTVRGTLPTKGKKTGKAKKKKKKLVVQVTSPGSIRRFGYIHADVSAPKGVDTQKEARTFGVRELHKRFQPKKELTLTHPGVTTLRRWDAIKVYLPNANLNLICFVTEVHHTVAPGSYTMDVTCQFTDPFVAQDKIDTAIKKCQAAKRGNRKPPKGCHKRLHDHVKSKKKRQRSAHS